MSSNSTHEFPSPVGGVPLPIDFAPSIIFAVLYAFLVPVAVWRAVHPRSRNIVVIGTSLFTIERVVGFALRAKASRDAGTRAGLSLEVYFQTTYADSWITIGQDLMHLLRSLLVASTLGGDMLPRYDLTPPALKTKRDGDRESLQELDTLGVSKAGRVEDSEPGLVDYPRLRFWVRQYCGISSILFLAIVIMSTIAGIDYRNAVKSGDHAALVRSLWYASTAMAIALIVGMALGALWAYLAWPRVPRSATLWIILVASLLSVVGIYRIAILGHSTTSLFSTAPGSQNSGSAKACFYVFHAAPEYLSSAILVSLNPRRVFGTGMWGDRRSDDPKPKKDEAK